MPSTHAPTPSRPQVRNSGIRTLFLSVSSQAARFDAAAWRYALWEIVFPQVAAGSCTIGGIDRAAPQQGGVVPLPKRSCSHAAHFAARPTITPTHTQVTYVHVMGDTSSSKEADAVELGREKGKAVVMLMHHSRNTEQKQWWAGQRGGGGGGVGCMRRRHE